MTDRSFRIYSGVSTIVFAAMIAGLNALLVPTGAPSPGAGVTGALNFYENSALVLWTVSLIPLAWAFSILFSSRALWCVCDSAVLPSWLVGISVLISLTATS